MCKQYESSYTSVGLIDNSPVLVLPGQPTTPTISPLFIAVLRNSKSPLYALAVAKIYTLESSLWISIKTSFEEDSLTL